ncbi:MAG: toxin-antitoxin system HicB family antitoxin [Pirellulaceae bacterium]|nr:toxin-antitoxin system HicB family antitoxin [Pirellulaceae bacterium]
MFGVGGPFARLFPVQAERKAFLKTEEHAAIKKMIPSITGDEEGDSELPSGKFVVRVPRSMHSALQKEASEEGVSLNQLVVAKLAIGLGKHTVLSS